MPAFWGAVVAGGASLVGDVISSNSQQSTNAMSAAEAQKNRDFQSQQTGRVMDWETEMSDTAMQRRVADLKAAGLNPMLAIGQGGASQPSVSPGGGSMPSFSNPGASFGNLGNQMSSAVDVATTGSRIALNNAQANASAAQAAKNNADAAKTAGVDTDMQRQNIGESQSRQALMAVQSQATVAQAALSTAQMRVADSTLDKVQAEISNLRSQTDLNAARSNVEQIQSMLLDLDIQQRTAIMPDVIQSAANAARLSALQIPEGESRANFWASMWGQHAPGLSVVGNVLKTLVMLAK